MKQTKNLLTRDMCQKELIHLSKASVHMSIVFLVIMGVLTLLFVLMGIWCMNDYSVILGLILIIAFVALYLFFVKGFIEELILSRRASAGRFYIVKDTVSRLSRGEPAGKYRTVDALYFTKYGRFVPTQTVFNLTSLGDEFYLVIIPTKKPKICFAFHTMMYECNDVDDVNI